jgi:hypothetical protein
MSKTFAVRACAKIPASGVAGQRHAIRRVHSFGFVPGVIKVTREADFELQKFIRHARLRKTSRATTRISL